MNYEILCGSCRGAALVTVVGQRMSNPAMTTFARHRVKKNAAERDPRPRAYMPAALVPNEAAGRPCHRPVPAIAGGRTPGLVMRIWTFSDLHLDAKANAPDPLLRAPASFGAAIVAGGLSLAADPRPQLVARTPAGRGGGLRRRQPRRMMRI